MNIVCHRSEMGQGIRTGVPQVIAEELGVDWEQVNVVQGLADERYGSQNTDGSRSIRRNFTRLRQMGATARTMLEKAAADIWKSPVEEVRSEGGYVIHSSGRKLGFGYLAPLAAKLEMPALESVKLKPRDQFKFIGKDITIVDLPDIATGNTEFGQDVQLDNMLIASIERSPVTLGKVKAFDGDAAKAISGVVEVFQMPDQPKPVLFTPINGVAVIAENTWAAMQGRKALNVQWDDGENASHDSQAYMSDLTARIVDKGKTVRNRGDAYASLEQSDSSVSATYTMPYLAHAPMEPPAATAVVKDGECEIWACTQTPQSTQMNVAQALGIDRSKVKVNVTLLGGGFGRKSKPDFSVEAALLARHMKRPVKVIWTREDDIRHCYYHAISAQHFVAGIKDGGVDSWIQRTAFPSISWTFTGTTDEPSDGELSLGFGDIPFAVNNLTCETHKATAHTRIGWVRSVSNIHHAFARGSFVDEIADALNKSPVDTWMDLLGSDRTVDPNAEGFQFGNYGDPMDVYPIDTKRLKHCLKLVVDKSGADKPTAENEGWGIAVHRSFVSYVAVATKVRVEDNKVTVLEMHNSIDAGTVVNPDRVRSQQEGSMMFGLSLALMGEISFKDGSVVQSNYHDYPVLRIHQCPDIETYIVESDAPPGGVGEPGTPPVAASLANAIFRASGKRIRDLPIKKHMSV